MTASTYYGGYTGIGQIEWKTTSLLLSPLSSTTTSSSAQYIHITNAQLSTNVNRPMESTYYAPQDTKLVSPIIMGMGTCNITGSVSFDMTNSNLNTLLQQSNLTRNTYFWLGIHDGNKGYSVDHCVWTNFTISASAGGLVNCQISFNALNNRNADFGTYALPNGDKFADTLIAYWQSGANNHMESFSLSFTQQVTPVYLNNDFFMPTYLRCGSVGINATIESWFDWEDTSTIKIGDKKITFNNKCVNVKEFTHSGAGDVGKHSYQITSVATTKPDDNIFTIT